MSNCAFLQLLTTQNDIYGRHNCPVVFRCELYSDDNIEDGSLEHLDSKPKGASEVKMIPDEPILPNGRAVLGFDMDSHKPENFSQFIPLEDGLKKIYKILETIIKNNIYIAGFGLKRNVFNILNDSFKRVLNLEPLVFPTERTIDVLHYAIAKIPVEQIGAYTIKSLQTYFNLEETDEKTAKNQLFAIRNIFMQLTTIDSDWKFDEVVNSISKTTKIESFSIGKYKGAKIRDVMREDQQYCRWFLANASKYDNAQLIAEKLKELFNNEET